MASLSFKPLKTRVGHATLENLKTGCTVLLFDSGATCGVHTAGGSPGTRETDFLDPTCRLEKINGLLLTGGSAFGLSAADGVMRFLAEKKIGHPVGKDRIPIVPAAVIYDRKVNNRSSPGPSEGYLACQNAGYSRIEEGLVGVGRGATVGKFSKNLKPSPGGVSVIIKSFRNIKIGVVMAVNAFGNIIDPAKNEVIAGATDKKGKKVPFAGASVKVSVGENTTIGAIVTDAALTKAEAKRVAMAAHDGLAKSIDPSHTLYDGDTLFVVSTGKKKADLAMLGIWAAQMSGLAVRKAVTR